MFYCGSVSYIIELCDIQLILKFYIMRKNIVPGEESEVEAILAGMRGIPNCGGSLIDIETAKGIRDNQRDIRERCKQNLGLSDGVEITDFE